MAFIPQQKTFAQCSCADGSTPDSLAYEQYLDSIIATNTIISFPQFDPLMGTLRCIKLSDTVTTVVSYNLKNDLGELTSITETDSSIFNYMKKELIKWEVDKMKPAWTEGKMWDTITLMIHDDLMNNRTVRVKDSAALDKFRSKKLN